LRKKKTKKNQKKKRKKILKKKKKGVLLEKNRGFEILGFKKTLIFSNQNP